MRISLLALVAVVAFLAGRALAGERLRIGLALPTQQEERWVRDMHAMREEARKNGVDLQLVIARNDQAQQNSQVEQLLSKDIGVLIIAPHDGEGAAEAVDKARATGVKVIAYDRLVLGTPVDVYMSFDNVRIGELMGDWLVKRVPKGDYVVMSGAPTDNNARLFKQGHMKALQPFVDRGDIRIVLDRPVIDWQPANAQRIVKDALDKTNGKLDAVLAPNDGTASGAIAALGAWGLAGKVPVTGMDAELSAARRIVQGSQSITVFKDTRRLGEAAIRLAIKMAGGESIDAEVNGSVDNGVMAVPSVLLDAEVVDGSNIDKVLVDSGYLTKEQIYAE